MGRICPVFYKEIDPQICSAMDAAEYHFYANVIGLHPMFNEAYENYELGQMNIRNRVLGDAVKNGSIKNLRMDSTIYGVSSLRGRAIVIAEI